MARQSLHVVVLAAGVGSRLSGSAARPKWLTPVGSHRIADLQLEGLRDTDHDVQIDVVTGHESAQVSAYLRGTTGTSEIFNPRYAELNNWYSVLVALEHRRAQGRSGKLVVLNSDLCAPAGWFTRAVDAAVAEDEPALVVDTGRALTDEAMKVSAVQGIATGIGKVGVDAPVGEYTGLLAVPAAAVDDFAGALAAFVDEPARVNAWYEHAVAATIDLGLRWRVVPAPGEHWVEVDDDRDLRAAEHLPLDPGCAA